MFDYHTVTCRAYWLDKKIKKAGRRKQLVVFLLDQSLSMEESIEGTGERKDAVVAKAINNWLLNNIIQASHDDGVRDYFDIAVIGYRTDQSGNSIIESALGGELTGRRLVTLGELDENAQFHTVNEIVFDEENGKTIEMETEAPFWVVPVAEGGTPMCSGLYKAYEIIDWWCDQAENKDNLPPVLIHVTDGQATDGDPVPYAEPIMDLGTSNGMTTVLNIFLSAGLLTTLAFPSAEDQLPTKDWGLQDLFKMSSILPDMSPSKAGTVACGRGLIIM